MNSIDGGSAHDLRIRLSKKLPEMMSKPPEAMWSQEQMDLLVGHSHQNERIAVTLHRNRSNPSYFPQINPAWAKEAIDGTSHNFDDLLPLVRVEVSTNNLISTTETGEKRGLLADKKIESILEHAANVNPKDTYIHTTLARKWPAWLDENDPFKRLVSSFDKDLTELSNLPLPEQHHLLSAYQTLFYEAYTQGDATRLETAREFVDAVFQKTLLEDQQSPDLRRLQIFTALLNAQKNRTDLTSNPDEKTVTVSSKPKPFTPPPR